MGAVMYAGSDLNNSPYAQFLGTPPERWIEASWHSRGVFRRGREAKGNKRKRWVKRLKIRV